MAPPSKPEKTMSSRLLTMKFMQRAAASAPPSNAPGAPHSPSSEPPAKRARLSSSAAADQRAVQDALAIEERKRAAALERQAAEAGETRWALRFDGALPASWQVLQVMSAGYGAIDAGRGARGQALERPGAGDGEAEEAEGDEASEEGRSIARRSFGRFNKAVEKQQNPDEYVSSSSDDGGSASEEEWGDDGGDAEKKMGSAAGDEARAKRKAQRKEKRAAVAQMAERRRSKEVKLNKLTSISSAGPASSPLSRSKQSSVACFKCGGPHLKRDCPRGA